MQHYHDIKGKLAKLLATEDLVVEHKQVDTAQFNVDTRVLTLPTWKISDNDVYDALVAHEVGHALYTPAREWFAEKKYQGVPMAFVNITEDVRIEKLMKRRYEGLGKTFHRGYSQLNQDDFFEIEGLDVDEFSFPDRINLHYKIGAFLCVNFTDEEQVIVDKIGQSETFEDALDIALELRDYCKEQEERNVEQVPAKVPTIPTGGGEEKMEDEGLDYDDQTVGQDTAPTSGEQEQGDYEEGDDEEGEDKVNGMEGGEHASEFDTLTVQNLESKLKKMVEKGDMESVYVQVPSIDLSKVTVSSDEIRQELGFYWQEEKKRRREYYKEHYQYCTPDYVNADPFAEVDQEFHDYKKSAAKEVNYLVKEFECKKSASAYARATTSKTGILDCTKLHTYKFNEDLFKKVTVVPDGKNHGLIFILDWSGSMSHIMLDTVKQLLNIVWFCKKVNIPFDVYAFSNEWFCGENAVEKCERKEDELFIGEDFGLLNFLSSSSKELDTDILNLYRLSSLWNRSYSSYYSAPRRLSLSGTPLNESVIALHKLIPDFKSRTGAEKVQCIVFTDGEAHQLRRNKTVNRRWEDEPYMGHAGIHANCFLRNRKTGRVTRFNHSWSDFTKVILDDLSSLFPEVNLIGFRVLQKRDASYFMRQHLNGFEEYKKMEKLQKDWRKNKCFALDNTGYAKYFGLSASALNEDTDFEVKEDAKKADIKRAFVKSLSAKKTNKKILNEFVDLIA